MVRIAGFNQVAIEVVAVPDRLNAGVCWQSRVANLFGYYAECRHRAGTVDEFLLAHHVAKKTNLAEREAALGGELDSRLRAHEASSRKWNPSPEKYQLSPELLHKLQQLGYAGDEAEEQDPPPRKNRPARTGSR